MFDSVTSLALQSALDGLSARQRVIAENVANINTPGYTAKRVQFEEALAASVASGEGRVAFSVSRSLEPTQLNGSNVNLDTETLSNIDTVLRYQFATQAVGGEANSLRTAMRTS
ncbi:flagellar basal body rod protein FlgB [Oerskovia jenensis]|uniref:Flagellar basal body rod protein FlgB n=1 Tax=Oerskovia jenensis TaxID=162169 RepID=A0ABS2LDI6_9CELL|nr:flagellar basal body rod protein FlgB [Oerskovia jenensis]MBM7478475.1 flagellar basal-body rod protein FlgB [Oerskovia jenensis]